MMIMMMDQMSDIFADNEVILARKDEQERNENPKIFCVYVKLV